MKPPSMSFVRARMFFNPCPAAADSPSKPSPSSTHQHEALVVARTDHDLGSRGVRVLAYVGETLLHDAEDLDLLVGREPDVGIDLEVDLELSVGGQELDVPVQGRVERCGSRAVDSARIAKRASCCAAFAASRSFAIVSSCGAPFCNIDA